MIMNTSTVINIGDLVRESIFYRGNTSEADKRVWRYGIVVDQLTIKGIVHDRMCKVHVHALQFLQNHTLALLMKNI